MPIYTSRTYLSLLLAGFVFLCPLFVSAQADGNTKTDRPVISEGERKAFESIIREYLLKNPTLLREMVEALRDHDEKEKNERAASGLKTYKDQIYNDPDSPVAGNPNGDLTIVVFVDYNCGYCRSNVPLIKALAAKDKMIRIIYKELPILGPNSEVAARGALAAHKQGKYVEFHDALFQQRGAGESTVKTVAVNLGLDQTALARDMADQKVRSAIGRNRALAAALGIEGTPAYIIGSQIIPGAVDAEVLDEIVADERSKMAQSKK
jgi:protein-disulfide isomerase